MKCDKCGAEVSATDVICPFCRASINQNENVTNQQFGAQEMPAVEPAPVVEPIPAVEPVVEPVPTVQSTPIVEQPQPFVNQPGVNSNVGKKKGKGLAVLLCIAVVAILGFFAYSYYSGSLEKDHKAKFTQAKNNLQNANSYTIKMAVNANIPMLYGDISADLIIKVEDNKYMISLDASQLASVVGTTIPKIEMYMDDEHIYIPIKSFISLASMGEDIALNSIKTDSDWLIIDLDSEELSEDFEYGAMFSNVDTIEEGLFEIFDEDNLKYIGSEDSIKHYKITLDKKWFKKVFDLYLDNSDIDKELKQEIKESWSEIETVIGDLKISYDVYFNSDTNYITKLEFDVLEFIKNNASKLEIGASELSQITSIVSELSLTVDFSDYNSTVVDIPSAAKKGTNIEEYMESLEKYYSDLYGFDEDALIEASEYLDDDLDLDLDFNL